MQSRHATFTVFVVRERAPGAGAVLLGHVEFHGVSVTVTVTVILFKCPKNKRPSGLPLDIQLLLLHLELPYMQNVLAHGTPPRSGVVA